MRLGFLAGDRKRFTGVVRQIGPNGTEAKWQFSDGWICKWEGPEFDASKNEISIETIEDCSRRADAARRELIQTQGPICSMRPSACLAKRPASRA